MIILRQKKYADPSVKIARIEQRANLQNQMNNRYNNNVVDLNNKINDLKLQQKIQAGETIH